MCFLYGLYEHYFGINEKYYLNDCKMIMNICTPQTHSIKYKSVIPYLKYRKILKDIYRINSMFIFKSSAGYCITCAVNIKEKKI